ncbi:MAG: 23S rRNA (uracil(1939)-C(5))-methyltransferase RlmD [Candidatus Magasanikbacteria bacterium CG_4_10_14_0_8_um_filter_32_14]|uniref:23S rRNA (Uracil(1939)-C(5))-methyltransferase RlmD n=2 Tax=Candidatus Magasanikiibacteriota TaxID=1752731 RepID=A0A2M7R9Z8_9BACT|nr:MAG: 23S rRNA (uracil-5-)-methyltransferase RumA [Candidatus Magasanikbacteria bacterium CG1_02_32_51]PIY93322.1 MAG: 23S rRNA (uracil(1939)-C(5))-methyltransferase RlmD [Candidatus Magasanikbacteria bacterium CG_4_10_14_0_8_um_filter_32_14]
MNTLKIEKLVFGGQGLARLDNKIVFVWNALPGEEVEYKIIKDKKDYLEAVATKIIKASPERVEAQEAEFLSTSPWQIISYQTENKWKKEITQETYKKLGGEIFADLDIPLISDKLDKNYRNKMEFSFTELEDNTKSLAFFERGGRRTFAVKGSILAEEIINETAQYILNWVNENEIPMRSLKSLIIRSNGQGQTIAALFIKDRLNFENYPKLKTNLLGFQIYYSTHQSPASVPTSLLYVTGQDYLLSDISKTKLKFGLLSFFQIHIPVFMTCLEQIKKHIPKNSSILDFYSGVGSIGLSLAKNCQNLTLVDNNEEAIEYAKENIKLNKLKNVEAFCKTAENITELITSDKILIVDPPRAGMHDRIVEKILQVTPPKIIYLSCNISTQARDVKKLAEKYKIVDATIYNFFPKTPHIEGLLILELK